QVERGAVERIVAAAVLGHGGELVALAPERGAAVDGAARRLGAGFVTHVAIGFGFAVRLAVVLGLTLGADLDPSRALHDLAGFGDEAARQLLVYKRQVSVRDAKEADVVGPAVRLLRGFVDAFGDKLLAIG